MDCKFHVGQRVAAIDEIECAGGVIAKGTVCTVSTVVAGRFLGSRTGPFAVETIGITLVEYSATHPFTHFNAAFFRPLDESRLDQFRAHLAPADRARVDEDA